MKKQATVAAAVLANRVLKYLKKTASRGLVFRTQMICWHLGDFVIGSFFATRRTPMSTASERGSRTEVKEVG